MHKGLHKQYGYFLILSVIFILIIGVMGSLIAYLFSNRARLSVAQANGLYAFYNAESGLEIGTRLLTRPDLTNRVNCGSLTGTSAVTNATLNTGTFTLATINSSPIFVNTTLSSSETSSDTTINLTSSSGFAPSGRVLIDREAIDYAAVSGNTLIGVTRGTAGTLASSHANATRVGQYQCSFTSSVGIPNLTTLTYQRQLQTNVELQYGVAVGNTSGGNWAFIHWNRPTEASWNSFLTSAGTETALNAVSMLSPVDGFAVGDVSASSLNILRWNGSSWALSTMTACSAQHLNGVSMVSASDGYIVGNRYRPACAGSGNYRYTILKWNGTSWSLLTPSTSPSIPADASGLTNLNAVSVIDTTGSGSATVGFAVGDSGTILQYNGTNWVANTSPTTRNLTGVYTVSASEAWAVGSNGTILKWNGSTWSTFTSPHNSNMFCITMLDTNGDGLAEAGWIGAASGRIASYNGSSWSFVDLGNTAINGISAINTNDVWAVGAGGAAYHYDGSSWTSFTSGLSVALNAVSMIPIIKNPAAAWKQNFR